MSDSNHLGKETSLYLLQHADNPVHWYSWGEQALAKARQENKPILLSIGYSACHWCHVMARESFADQETANLMNQWFINIKVDREERPDLDKIYQTAYQLLTGQPGGWPLTVFLTPDKLLPFYAGTYFPVEESFGRPGFKTVLSEVAHFYYQRSDTIVRITEALTQALEKMNYACAQGVVLDEKPLQIARQELEESFDFMHGGFGRAPKFPLPTHLEFLLHSYIFSFRQDVDACRMLDHSLTHMAKGGFTDQLGGGFFRYCVDANWMIPHFEKMLYDNAQLIPLYADFSRIKADEFLKATTLAALDWVLRDMRSLQGGFYSTINADSEGIEGKYYYWDREEVRKILTPLEYSAIEGYFGLNRPPNFEGHWHLFIAEQDESIYTQGLNTARKKLLAVREKRVAPSCDKKIIVSWNALLIRALVKSAQVFGEARYADAAQETLDFIQQNLWHNQRLLAVSANGHAHLPAYLDDYAFLLAALLDFLQLRWQDHYFEWALNLAEQMLTHFFDNENGGFFYTAADHESLIQRLKIFNDEALPSGNGVAVSCLLRLGHLLGEPRYLSAAEKTLQAAWEQINLRPSSHDSLLAALRSYFHPPVTIILRGDVALLQQWQQEFFQYYLPAHYCYALPSECPNLPTALLQKPSPVQGVQAYICRGPVCLEPINTLVEFSDYLQKI